MQSHQEVLVLLTVGVAFSLIHGCRCSVSHVIAVALGSVQLLPPPIPIPPPPHSSSLIPTLCLRLYHVLQALIPAAAKLLVLLRFLFLRSSWLSLLRRGGGVEGATP